MSQTSVFREERDDYLRNEYAAFRRDLRQALYDVGIPSNPCWSDAEILTNLASAASERGSAVSTDYSVKGGDGCLTNFDQAMTLLKQDVSGILVTHFQKQYGLVPTEIALNDLVPQSERIALPDLTGLDTDVRTTAIVESMSSRTLVSAARVMLGLAPGNI